MIKSTPSITFTMGQLGNLNATEAINAVRIANSLQSAFRFEWYPHPLPLDEKQHKLPNGGFVLDRTIQELLQHHSLSRPLILVTSVPYGIPEKGNEPDWFLFAEESLVFDRQVSVISTYLWENLPGPRRLQPYLLSILAAIVLHQRTGLAFHDETNGCLFDYCDDPKDIDQVFEAGRLCDSCEHHLQTKLRDGDISVEEIAAAKKLFHRAIGKKVCFVVMPFKRELKPVYDVIGQALQEEHWTVIRADEIVRPRLITDAILQVILTSNLVVVDLTGSNPNVFYELGIAHAAGCDMILLTQERSIPFDVKLERAIFYKAHKRGLRELENELRRLAGSGLF